MTRFSTPPHFIREHVFEVRTQGEFADMLKCSQASISVAETVRGRFAPKTEERVRELAKVKKIPWNDSWFFEVPEEFRSTEAA